MKQYFTFGLGWPNSGCYVEIEGETKQECRAEMVDRYGSKWLRQHNTKEDAGVERFGLRKIQ